MFLKEIGVKACECVHIVDLKTYNTTCGFVFQGVTKQIGGSAHALASKVDEYARGMISGSGSTLFEELGLYYIGPVDGHNMDDLVTILREVKNTSTTGPVLIHLVTEKGRGYPYAERAADKYHG